MAVAVGAAPPREQGEAVAGVAAQVPRPAQAHRIQEQQGQQQGLPAHHRARGEASVVARDGRLKRGDQAGLVRGGEQE